MQGVYIAVQLRPLFLKALRLLLIIFHRADPPDLQRLLQLGQDVPLFSSRFCTTESAAIFSAMKRTDFP